jgi:flagellum-specific ATP synthase
MNLLQALRDEVAGVGTARAYGRVRAVSGLAVEIGGPVERMGIGARLAIHAKGGQAKGIANGTGGPTIQCEVVGFHGERAIAMPFGRLDGVSLGARTELDAGESRIWPDASWLGRVVNGMGEPIDGKGPLGAGRRPYPLRSPAPPAHERRRIGAPLDLGVRALNTFTMCCRGQRMGIFSGSGIGKSMLFSMLARNTVSDVAVIGLIGERGREVQEFIEDDLAGRGLERSVVVVATADEAALIRRQAAYVTMTLAEYFRDQGNDVLCLIDSVTRFAMAQREIGLASGEPPTTKGYTPTVFSELPALLERAGPGVEAGSITGLFTVLVEGDDHNEPVADAVRAILDGHIVMERRIAERGRFPAINVLKSISRRVPACLTVEQRRLIERAKALMSAYADMEEIIRLGAYRAGSDPVIDRAIGLNPDLEAFLAQDKTEFTSIDEGYAWLARILGPDENEGQSE